MIAVFGTRTRGGSVDQKRDKKGRFKESAKKKLKAYLAPATANPLAERPPRGLAPTTLEDVSTPLSFEPRADEKSTGEMAANLMTFNEGYALPTTAEIRSDIDAGLTFAVSPASMKVEQTIRVLGQQHATATWNRLPSTHALSDEIEERAETHNLTREEAAAHITQKYQPNDPDSVAIRKQLQNYAKTGGCKNANELDLIGAGIAASDLMHGKITKHEYVRLRHAIHCTIVADATVANKVQKAMTVHRALVKS
jgi:hypothetical protein